MEGNDGSLSFMESCPNSTLPVVESAPIMKFTSLFALAAIVMLFAGCDQLQPQNQPAAQPHYQRFLPISPPSTMTEGVPWHGYFALDTKTGTLCSTMKDRVFRKGTSDWANDVPNCAQLLAENPD